MASSESFFCVIIYRLPSSAKAFKSGKSEATPAKGSLTSGKQTPPQMDNPAQQQSETDVVDFTILSFLSVGDFVEILESTRNYLSTVSICCAEPFSQTVWFAANAEKQPCQGRRRQDDEPSHFRVWPS